MAERVALGRAQIRERGGRGAESRRQVGHAERGERVHAEVGAEIRRGAPGREGRRVAEGQRRARRLQPSQEDRIGARGVGQQDLRGAPQERGRQDLRPFPRVLACPELAGRDVDERHADRIAARAHRQQEIVRGALQVGGVRQGPRGDDLHDVAPQELFFPAGRLELLAHRNLLAGVHEPGDVSVGGVVRDSRHRRALASRQRDLEQARRQLGVLEERLVEVAQPEQEHVIGIATLEVAVLPHHRREVVALSHRAGP